MTETTSPALRTALAYFQAWTSHDLDKAMEYIADDIVCDAPAGRLEDREAYLGFMRPFVQILTGSALIAAFGDDTTAVVVYDTKTVPVASAPAAECVIVTDGKITYNRFIFDLAPFDAARQTARPPDRQTARPPDRQTARPPAEPPRRLGAGPTTSSQAGHGRRSRSAARSRRAR